MERLSPRMSAGDRCRFGECATRCSRTFLPSRPSFGPHVGTALWTLILAAVRRRRALTIGSALRCRSEFLPTPPTGKFRLQQVREEWKVRWKTCEPFGGFRAVLQSLHRSPNPSHRSCTVLSTGSRTAYLEKSPANSPFPHFLSSLLLLLLCYISRLYLGEEFHGNSCG